MKNCLAMVSPEVHSTQVVWIELTEFSIRHKRHKPWRVYDREFRFVSWKAEERSKQNFSSNYNGIQKFWKRTPDMLLTDVVQPLHLQWNLPPLHNMVEGTTPIPSCNESKLIPGSHPGARSQEPERSYTWVAFQNLLKHSDRSLLLP